MKPERCGAAFAGARAVLPLPRRGQHLRPEERAKASLAPTREEILVNEETRRERTLGALELIAEEMDCLRMLREHEMGVRVVDEDGDPFVRPTGGG